MTRSTRFLLLPLLAALAPAVAACVGPLPAEKSGAPLGLADDPAAGTEPLWQLRGPLDLQSTEPGLYEPCQEVAIAPQLPGSGFVGYTVDARRLDHADIFLTAPFDTYLLVYGPGAPGAWGKPLAWNDDTPYPEYQPSPTDSEVSIRFPQDGTYLLLVSSYDNVTSPEAVRPDGVWALDRARLWFTHAGAYVPNRCRDADDPSTFNEVPDGEFPL